MRRSIADQRKIVGERSQPASASLDFGVLTSLPDIRALLEFRVAIESECAGRAAIQHASAQRKEIRSRRRQFERAIASGAPAIDVCSGDESPAFRRWV